MTVSIRDSFRPNPEWVGHDESSRCWARKRAGQPTPCNKPTDTELGLCPDHARNYREKYGASQ